MSDPRIPFLDGGLKEQLKQLKAATSPLKLPPVDPALRRELRSFLPAAQQARADIAALRQDIVKREKDIAGLKESLRQYEAWAEREFGIPAPRPAPVGLPLVAPSTANPPTAETINDNGAAAAVTASPLPSVPESQRLRGRTPIHDWHTIDAEIVSRCYQSGRLIVPEDENVFAEQMLHWYVEELHRHMSPSTMREAVRAVFEHLRKSSQTPRKTLARKPSR